MTREDILAEATKRAHRRIESEQLIIAYESDAAAIRALLPDPLQPAGNTVLCSFVAVPLPGRGSEVEMRVLLPARLHERDVLYVPQTFVDEDDPLQAAARIGLATRHAHPRLVNVHDTVCGVLALHGEPFAVAGMQAGWEARERAARAALQDALLQSLHAPQVQLRVILDGVGTPALAQLIAATPTEVRVRHAWSGAAQLQILPYPPAPLADLPVERTLGGVHAFAELTFGAAEVLHDYQAGPRPVARKAAGKAVHAVPALLPEEVLQ